MKITKILASEATPAKVILDRAQHIALTSSQRAQLPTELNVNGSLIAVALPEPRPLEVGDVMLDDAGHFYVVDAAPESVLIIKGDEEFASEAAVALLNRGIRVAQTEEGFAIAKDEALLKLLTEAGLEFQEAQMPFDPIKLPKRHHGGCCCGHHHHEHGEGCTCGCHDHDHEHGHHHADDVFTSWGKETPHKFERAKLEEILKQFVEDDKILRSKGMVEGTDGKWIYFDMVPGEYEIRDGEPDYTGRIVVIGTDIHEHELEELFGLA